MSWLENRRTKKQKESDQQQESERIWNEGTNLEKARQALGAAENFPFAPGAAAGYSHAIALLLLELVERIESNQLTIKVDQSDDLSVEELLALLINKNRTERPLDLSEARFTQGVAGPRMTR